MSDKSSLVSDYILDLIETDKIATGSRISSAREICSIVEVSFAIAQAGINNLVRAGVLEASPRKGTFLREKWNESILPRVCVPYWSGLLWLDLVEPLLKEKEIRLSRKFDKGMFEIKTTYEMQRDQRDYLDLSPFFEEIYGSGKDFFSDPFEGFWSQSGALFGIPMIFSPRVMFYNKSLLKSVGIEEIDRLWTWDDFIGMVRLLRGKLTGDQIINWGRYPFIWMNLVFRAGGKLIDPHSDDPIQIDNPLTIKGLRLYAQLGQELGTDLKTAVNKGFITDFCENRLAFMIGTRQDLCRVSSSSFTDWGVVKLPLLPGGKETTAQATELLCVRRECRDYDGIRDFIEIMLSEQMQDLLGEIKYGIPIRKSSANKSMDLDDQNDMVFFNEMPNISAEYNLDSPELSALVLESINQIIAEPDSSFKELADSVRFFYNTKKEMNSYTGVLASSD